MSQTRIIQVPGAQIWINPQHVVSIEYHPESYEPGDRHPRPRTIINTLNGSHKVEGDATALISRIQSDKLDMRVGHSPVGDG